MGTREPSEPTANRPELAIASYSFEALVRELAAGTPTTPEDRAKYYLLSRFNASEQPIELPFFAGRFDQILIGLGHPHAEGGQSHTIELRRTIRVAAPTDVVYTFRTNAEDPLQILDDREEVLASCRKVIGNERGQQRLLALYQGLTDQVEERKLNGTLREAES